MSAREVEPGIYEHKLEIHSLEGKKLAKMCMLGLELSAPPDWHLISADVTFQQNEGTAKSPEFSKLMQIKEGTNNAILLRALPVAQKVKSGPQKGVLKIKSTGAAELSVWVQKSNGKPVTSILWTSVPTTEGDSMYASLSGWFQYSEEGVPDYSKAELLSHAWGMGVGWNKTIYTLVGIAFLFWILGMILPLIAPDLLGKNIPLFIVEAIGCSLILGSICLIFSFIFPPFHGPDEVHHFSGYIESSGRENLVSNALEIANLGAFDRIHRNNTEKYASIDVTIKNQNEWPPDTANPYYAGRSPLGILIWKCVKGIIDAQNAGLALLQLRVVNSLFVALCLLLALIVAGSIFPMRHLASWFSLPVLIMPCVAHYSTAVSNYPFLIGGYIVQMVVLGILWTSLDCSVVSRRNLTKIGTLLGLGIGIALCSADNAMVILPFWFFILPSYLMSRVEKDNSEMTCIKDAFALFVPMIAALLFLCSFVATVSNDNSFLPGTTGVKITPFLAVYGNQFLAGIALLLFYFGSIFVFTYILYSIIIKLTSTSRKVPWYFSGMIVIATSVGIILLFNAPKVPEIDISRGGNTTAVEYAVTIVGAFADGLFPGKPDEMISESFWRRLGWGETNLPLGLMEFLRLTTGLGIVLLMWKSLHKSFHKGRAMFAIANIIGLIACVATIGMLYFLVLYNVNSRYILVAYLFAVILAVEGYRKILSGYNNSMISNTTTSLYYISILAIGLQCWSWITVLNRYF